VWRFHDSLLESMLLILHANRNHGLVWARTIGTACAGNSGIVGARTLGKNIRMLTLGVPVWLTRSHLLETLICLQNSCGSIHTLKPRYWQGIEMVPSEGDIEP
jgi:hypothetical protein